MDLVCGHAECIVGLPCKRTHPEVWGARPPTDEELDTARRRAEAVWCYRTDDEIWQVIFTEGENVAAELLERITSDSTWTVGDLTHKQVLDRITRRYPFLRA